MRRDTGEAESALSAPMDLDRSVDAAVVTAHDRPAQAWTQWPSQLALLSAVVLVAAVGRAWVIGHYAEPDGDAKGHLGIATQLLTDPFNVHVHWVWPPGYHYFLAGLLRLGASADGVRYLNCGLAAALPLLVWRYAWRSSDPSASPRERLVPLLAGCLCAVMPVVNFLGCSAQPGTLFAILVLLAVGSIDARRFALAGAALSIAVMVRYEAAGAIALLAVLRLAGAFPRLARRLPKALRAACSFPIVLVIAPLTTVFAWLLAQRVAEGTWFGFLLELYRYTHVQRGTFLQKNAWTDFVFFPLVQPYYLFGLTLPLCVLGMRRAWTVGFVVPLGIYLFLLGSYACKGVLGSGRYYESLTPYLCIAAARGAIVVGQRWRLGAAVAYVAALGHLARLLVLTGRWAFHFEL